jgi:2-methylisocitrate lyase-like PEP mutase family enzyme
VTKDDQRRLAEAFRSMHQGPRLLLLPNAWDAMSARLFEASGFAAIATTSSGMSWSLGYPDGEKAPWDEVVAATRRIVRAVRVPVSADIEAGYGDNADQVARRVSEIIDAGVVGINLEDSTDDPAVPVRSIEDAAERIGAAREAARVADVPIVINARVDLYLKHVHDDATRLRETERRAKAYAAAGADCIFPFALTDLDILGKLIAAVKLPVNVVGRPGTPSIARLEEIGVARVSIASGATMAVMSQIRRIAEELGKRGGFEMLQSSMKRPDVQNLFARTD